MRGIHHVLAGYNLLPEREFHCQACSFWMLWHLLQSQWFQTP